MRNYAVSKFQEQFWLLNKLAPQSASYNIPSLIRFENEPDIHILETALHFLVKKHEALRSYFSVVDDRLCQIIRSTEECVLNISSIDIDTELLEDVSKHPAIHSAIHKPFNLSEAPLLRCSFFRDVKKGKFYLCIVFHHIIVDLHSKTIFARELSEIYNAAVQNRTPDLESVISEYSEFSDWHNEWLKSENAIKMISDWEKQLPKSNTLLELPADKQRPKFSQLRGKRDYFILDDKLSAKVNEFAQNNSTNSFVVFLTAYSILLHRHSQQNKIVIGVPFSNRRDERFKDTFGLFVNVLPISIDFAGSLTEIDIIKQVRNQMLLAHRKQEIPFVSLVNSSSEKRNTSYNPFFQTGFTFEPPMNLNLIGSESVTLPFEREGAQLDQFLTMWEENGRFAAYMEYSGDLFEPDTIKRFTENFISTVESILSNPEVSIDKLNCTSQLELECLEKFNNTKVPVAYKFVHEMFEKQVSVSINKTALICNNETLTYAQLDLLANKISHYLISKGVRGNDVVGISLNRSFLMVAGVLGILKTGAAYLPLDPSFPKDRLSYMLSDSNAKLFVTELQLENYIETTVEKILLDNIQAEINRQPETKPIIEITSDSLAYLIYTSGSTGMPKGVKVHHGAVANFIESMAVVPGFSVEDILLAVTTLSFDISVLELFLPLFKGGTIVLAQKLEVINGSALIRLMETHSVTVLQATPATWNILNHTGWQGNKKMKALCGGEAISVSLIETLLPKVGELWNMYGPTETTVWSTCGQITSAEPPVLIGKPINNTTIYMISPNNAILPIGCAGEVCIGGLGVTKGYHNRQELTDEKFITLPNGEFIYKTGDVGKYRFDGQIELFGRIDNQIKLRGFRIEPGEIEVQICKSEGVLEAVVKVQKFSELDERLVAFLNVKEASIIDLESITQRLRAHLPDYMIPVHFKIMDSFPRTPNGKINKKELFIEEADVVQIQNEVIPKPNSEKGLERSILEIWMNIIRKQNITINDNFFDIGGNSLLLIQVANAINKMIDKEVDIMYYFEYPTVKALSAYLVNNTQIVVETVVTEDLRANQLKSVAERRRRNLN